MTDEPVPPERPRAVPGKSRIPRISPGSAARAGTPRVLREIAISGLGLIALLTPLALWVSWSPMMFTVILLTGGLAIGAIFLLVWLSKDEYL